MEYIRKTVNSKLLESLFDLPENMKNKKVEVIVFPLIEKTSEKIVDKSLAGSLNKYANPSMIRFEKDAWSFAAEEKHENR